MFDFLDRFRYKEPEVVILLPKLETAKRAKELSALKLRNIVIKAINDAIDHGEFSVTIYQELTQELIEELKETYGYTVEQYSSGAFCKTMNIISWF